MFLLILVLICFCSADETEVVDVKNYLIKYGYLNVSQNALTNLEHALINFQEFYHLETIDGTPNEETLSLMEKRRCGLPDEFLPFTIHNQKWHKSKLLWYTPLATTEMIDVTKAAFQVWSNVANLEFIFSPQKPDIVIFMASPKHSQHEKCQKGKQCMSFGGIGQDVAHAFLPNNNECREIHLDSSEDWWYGLENISQIPKEKISLYWTLAHEIGHVLGLHHSGVKNALMYPIYGNSQLDEDDILAIQYLYGPPITTESTKAATTTTITPKSSHSTLTTTTTTIKEKLTSKSTQITSSTTVAPTPSSVLTQKDLCDLNPKNLQFFILHSNLYVIHNKRLWIMNIETKQLTSKDIPLQAFIPVKFNKITAIYQRPSKEISIVVDNDKIFYLDDHRYTVIKAMNLSSFQIPPIAHKIIGAVNTNTGQTFFFFPENIYVEIDECANQIKHYGYISRDFPGIPSEIDSVFRYTNGRLYFFQKDRYFEYNEFTKSLEASDKISFEKFGIPCPNLTLFEQLKILLNKILYKK